MLTAAASPKLPALAPVNCSKLSRMTCKHHTLQGLSTAQDAHLVVHEQCSQLGPPVIQAPNYTLAFNFMWKATHFPPCAGADNSSLSHCHFLMTSLAVVGW